jgi:hypothetical protein
LLVAVELLAGRVELLAGRVELLAGRVELLRGSGQRGRELISLGLERGDFVQQLGDRLLRVLGCHRHRPRRCTSFNLQRRPKTEPLRGGIVIHAAA